MKNSLKSFSDACWQVLTEVPGWPDAPRLQRIKRLTPIALPVVAMFLLLLWNVTWRDPRMRAERARHQPIIALEQEVTDLSLCYSDQQVAETAAKADEVGKILLNDPQELPIALNQLKDAASGFGWVATLNPTVAPSPPASAEAQIYYLPSRGKLTPTPGNPQPFTSLLAYLEQIPASGKWFDLVRLSLRADDQGRHTVEISLRSGCRVPNEKTPQ